MILYNKIGINYNRTRKADPRIVKQIILLLNSNVNSKIADIGAGTGNYSYELARYGYQVYALEPANIMHKQRKTHNNLKWFKGFAENIPFKDASFDGAICILASHHFTSLEKAIAEIARILKKNGVFVLFSVDPGKAAENCWIKDYFHKIHNKTLPDQEYIIELLEKSFKNKCAISDFKLPPDLKDGFFYSAWRMPEKYLDKEFRTGISIFSIQRHDEVEAIISKLAQDLKNGKWEQKYGHVLTLNEYNGGYYFIKIVK
ncbi:MAG: class I SAM-dependent methyltransferase [Spirochaetales bacterium]|nr:class I SAM-dependent methyltransferase [Spirochaetales bacterium]